MLKKYSPWLVEERHWWKPWRSANILWYYGSAILVGLLMGALLLGLVLWLTGPVVRASNLSWVRHVRPCCSSDVCLKQRHHVSYTVKE